MRTDPSVHAEYLLIDKGANGHDVKNIRKYFPEFDVVLAFACLTGLVH